MLMMRHHGDGRRMTSQPIAVHTATYIPLLNYTSGQVAKRRSAWSFP